jgi:protein associated with RNAse G/E
MVQSRLTVCKDMRRIIAERNEWNNKIFINELKYTTEAEKALIKKDEKLPYLIEQGKQDLTSQVISITQEFMQKLRL